MAAAAWFAHGAFSFEREGYHRGRLIRWLGAESTIPVFGPAKFWLFETRLAEQPGSVAFGTTDGTPLRLTVKRGEKAYLPLTAGGRFVPERHKLVASPAVDRGLRQVAASVVYPPNAGPGVLPALLALNAPLVENGEGRWMECASSCRIALDVNLLVGLAPAVTVVGGAAQSGGTIFWGVRLERGEDVRLPEEPFSALQFDFSGILSAAGAFRPVLPVDSIRSSKARWVLLAVDKPPLSSQDARVVRVSLIPPNLP